MRDHFYHICRFRRELSAVIEFRKRVSWYARQMHPCQVLKEQMRTINTPADFEEVLARFLDWRLRHDDDVRHGRARGEAAQPDLVEAA